ncbi:uncharacterized protein BP01DRAFT_358977 [Aspergillus saccharolyticus JOP 1030-1]|uniref:Tetraspanin Tsp3 n=1 Tax=Aspergillus saccharolyticus JOP 1030-1 TaxID=1450539 RepID=A0A318ZE75_9EURO|nr:hypothetical protein BP01DRAFT_358977 [Aspergillus saccharolyticus JOP 1030-1]PYH42993.1 hypothetical protein BP01DRAFT_358977 [Aspergillus saccharolyticus JOP 1030-1]
MPIKLNAVFLIHLLVILFSIFAFILAVIAWTRTTTFHLPLPFALPILTTLLVPFTLINFLLTTLLTKPASTSTFMHVRTLFNTLHTILSTLLFSIAILYLSRSNPINACTLDQTWQAFFHARDAPAIRAIQDRLQCCGLRSLHDRAWPFKNRDHGDDACALQMGYTRSCLGPWRAEEAGVLWLIVGVVVVTGSLKIAFWVLRGRGMEAGWIVKADGAGGDARRRREYQRILDREVEEGGEDGSGVEDRDHRADERDAAARLLPHSESGYEWRQE